MRAEKTLITTEYLERLNSSPFFIVVDYQGLTVTHFNELRRRLREANGEIHVVKNNLFRIAAKEAGVADLNGGLSGQIAAVTGQQDISAVAKVLKNFQSEFDKPKLKFGFLNNERIEADALNAIADLPPMNVIRGQLMGMINAPATKLARLINTPGQQLAQVIKAKSEKGE